MHYLYRWFIFKVSERKETYRLLECCFGANCANQVNAAFVVTFSSG